MSVDRGGSAEFGRWLARQAEEIPAWFSLSHKRLHFDLMNRLIEDSPVGDPDQWAPQSKPPPKGYTGGRFRGNWQSATPSDSKQREVRRAEDRSESEVKLANVGDVSALQPYSRTFLMNNVPYSIRLAEGWSKQTPNTWVQDAIDAAAEEFSRSTSVD
jgi:hypothetical protein